MQREYRRADCSIGCGADNVSAMHYNVKHGIAVRDHCRQRDAEAGGKYYLCRHCDSASHMQDGHEVMSHMATEHPEKIGLVSPGQSSEGDKAGMDMTDVEKVEAGTVFDLPTLDEMFRYMHEQRIFAENEVAELRNHVSELEDSTASNGLASGELAECQEWARALEQENEGLRHDKEVLTQELDKSRQEVHKQTAAVNELHDNLKKIAIEGRVSQEMRDTYAEMYRKGR